MGFVGRKMYYEETIIDGYLYCRSLPNDPWRPVEKINDAIKVMSKLTSEERDLVVEILKKGKSTCN